MIQKNDTLTLHCDRLGSELEGVCNHDGMAVFVPGVLPGEDAETLIVKTQPRYAFGKLLKVHTPSPDRAEPLCPVYDKCGGCSGTYRWSAPADPWGHGHGASGWKCPFRSPGRTHRHR